jgi:hypothetical protein
MTAVITTGTSSISTTACFPIISMIIADTFIPTMAEKIMVWADGIGKWNMETRDTGMRVIGNAD